MITIKVTKNGKLLKSMRCVPSMKNTYFNMAKDFAGGLWNGVDVFKVVVG